MKLINDTMFWLAKRTTNLRCWPVRYDFGQSLAGGLVLNVNPELLPFICFDHFASGAAISYIAWGGGDG